MELPGTACADIPAAIAKAFYIARTGRPGPVVVDITKDAQQEMAEYHYEKVSFIRSYCPSPAIDKEKIAEAAKLINLSRKPLALIGQGVILGGAEKELRVSWKKAVSLPLPLYWDCRPFLPIIPNSSVCWVCMGIMPPI